MKAVWESAEGTLVIWIIGRWGLANDMPLTLILWHCLCWLCIDFMMTQWTMQPQHTRGTLVFDMGLTRLSSRHRMTERCVSQICTWCWFGYDVELIWLDATDRGLNWRHACAYVAARHLNHDDVYWILLTQYWFCTENGNIALKLLKWYRYGAKSTIEPM